MADYIERSKVIEITAETGALETQSRVRSLPAADVAPVVHARWVDDVYHDPYGAKWTKYRCSLCGRIEVVKEPYCNCGAKMEGQT